MLSVNRRFLSVERATDFLEEKKEKEKFRCCLFEDCFFCRPYGVAVPRRMVVAVSGPWTLIMAALLVYANGGGPVAVDEAVDAAAAAVNVSCEVARMKCAFRVGCGMALQNYMMNCADVMSGRIRRCSDPCKKALIALTSTEEGQDLMRCDCEQQKFCDVTKARTEICRPEVMRANEDDVVVSCSVAQWICAADPLCSTAVEYYRRLCRSMFHGKKCTPRCNNSISILNRQEKAAKLKTCVCDGTEDYDCDAIKFNMDRLCFHKGQSHHRTHQGHDVVQGDLPRDDGHSSKVGHRHPHSACSRSAFAGPSWSVRLLTASALIWVWRWTRFAVGT